MPLAHKIIERFSCLFRDKLIKRLMIAALVIKAVMVCFAIHSGATLDVPDPDTWLHLLRMEELWQNHDWYSTLVARDNTPYGAHIHWSRLLDVLVLIPAGLLAMFMPIRDALLLVAPWWNWLVMACLLLPLLLFITNRMGKTAYAQGFVLASVILNIFYKAVYMDGMVDHHSLLANACLGCFAVAVAWNEQRENLRLATLLGIIAGLGTWLSVEFLFPTLLFLCWIGYIWLRDGNLRPLLHIVGAMLSVIAVAFFLEQRPELWLKQEHISLSIVHLGAMIYCFLGLLALNQCSHELTTPTRRLTAGCILAVTLFALLAYSFGPFWKGALADIGPEAYHLYVMHIVELMPLHVNIGVMGTIGLASALITLPAFLRKAFSSSRDADSDLFLLLSLLVAVMVVMTLFQTRWYHYSIPIATLAMALWVDDLIASRFWHGVTARWSVIGLAILPTVFYLAGGQLTSPAATNEIVATSGAAVESGPAYDFNTCDKAMSHALQQDYLSTLSPNGAPLRVIVPPDHGTQVLFFSQNSILGSNFMPGEGPQALDDFLFSNDEKKAFRVAQSRRMDALMLCPPDDSDRMATDFIKGITSGTQVPGWLDEVHDHPWVKEGLKIFRVLPLPDAMTK